MYYWLLAGWVRVLGDSVAALRGLSVLLGVAGVAGVMGLGKALWRPAAGMAAGLVAAASPYLIWYSQEVRSYILIAALVPLLVYMALASPEGRRTKGWWLGVTLATAAALYTHYLCGAVAVAAANVTFGMSVMRVQHAPGIARRHGGPGSQADGGEGFGSATTRPSSGGYALRRWIGAQLLAGALFAPWIVYALPALTSWPATSAALGIPFMARESARLMSMGNGPSAPVGVGIAALWALLGVAAYRSGRLGAWSGVVPLAVAAGAPAALAVLSLSRPAWDAKFLAPSAPGFELLLGAGLVAPALAARARAGRFAGSLVFALAAATVLVPRAGALAAVASDPAHQRDDYRGLADLVARTASADDAVILNAPTQVEVFGYYHGRGRHRGALRGAGDLQSAAAAGAAIPAYGLPETRPAVAEDTVARLEEITVSHGDLFGVLWATAESDPDGIVEAWLNTNRPKAYDRWFGGVRLVLWGATAADPEETGLTGVFDSVLRLDHLTLGARRVRAGGVVELTASWLPVAAVGRDVVVFAQLLDDSGGLAAGRDLSPVGGSAHTSAWDPSLGRQTDRIGLAVPYDLPPGTYRLILGVYDAATGQRLPVAAEPGVAESGVTESGDALAVAKIEVAGQP